jgi:hypothetical protein
MHSGSGSAKAGISTRIGRARNLFRGYSQSGLRIRITLMRIRIQLFTLMLIRIRIHLFNKVIKSAATGLQTLQGSILSLQASNTSVYGHPRLPFGPLKVLKFDFIWIRIRENYWETNTVKQIVNNYSLT